MPILNCLEQFHIDKTPTEERDLSPLVDDRAREYINQLIPPVGTSFFANETISVFDNKQLLYTDFFGQKYPAETITWRTDVYKYVVSVKPDDPNFQQKGGAIYIIMVHSGVAQTGAIVGPSIQYMQSIEAPSSVIPLKQYPATDSGVKNGDNWDYSIGYQQTMPMFNNGGNSTFNFDARYKEDFTRTKSQQTGSETTTGVEFMVKYDTHPEFYYNFPVIGFSVFKCLDPNIFPIKFTFKASVGERYDDDPVNVWDSATKEVNIGFDFS